MIERAISIVITIVIFMIIAYVFIGIFGVPSCAHLANQTALQLKFAINEVADDSFPSFEPEDPKFTEPTNSYYYSPVPIRLCQQYGTQAFFMSFLGGMPEYQIYYEHFPEGGGGMWNEAYPWSGGAATSFIFWAGMRGVVTVGKALWKITTIKSLFKAGQLTYKGVEVTAKRVDGIYKITKTDELKNLLKNVLPELAENNRQWSLLTKAIADADAENLLEILDEAGLLKRTLVGSAWVYELVADGEGGFRFLLPDKDIPATIIKNVPDPLNTGGYIKKVQEIYAFQDSAGKLDLNDILIRNPGVPPPDPNYVKVMINPRKQMEEIYNSLKETQPRRAEMLLDYFTHDPSAGTTLLDDITKINLIKKIYYTIDDGIQKRWDEIKTFLKRHLYLSDTTSMPGNEVLYRMRAMEDLAALPVGDPVGDKFREILKPMMTSEDLGIWDKIRYFASKIPGIDVTPDVNVEIGLKIVKREWEEFGGGFAFLHKSDPTNVVIKMRDLIESQVFNAGGAVPSVADLVDHAKASFDAADWDEYFKAYGDAGGWDTLAQDIIDAHTANPLILADFKVATEKTILETLVNEIDNPANSKEVQEMFQQQLGMLIGSITKDDSPMPAPLWKKYAGKQVKKMLFIDGTAFIAPNSWFVKGLILAQMTEKCEGNSVCLYVQATQYESPYYLSEDATEYTVRVWRPFEWWKKFLGWQAALQHVPEHPRLYVVSPCFAVAKVWKTTVNDEPTIFVNPVRVPMEGKSNYCYADTNLVNTYTGIWAAEDIATVLEVVVSWGGAAAKKAGLKGAEAGFKKVAKSTLFKWYDMLGPASFIAAMAEGAIGWPGFPYSSLSYEDMLENKENTQAFEELKESLESSYE